LDVGGVMIQLPARARDLCLLQSVQTVSGVHSASYLMRAISWLPISIYCRA